MTETERLELENAAMEQRLACVAPLPFLAINVAMSVNFPQGAPDAA